MRLSSSYLAKTLGFTHFRRLGMLWRHAPAFVLVARHQKVVQKRMGTV
jgi:hypothetical protein